MTNSAVHRAKNKEKIANSKAAEEKLTTVVDIVSDLEAKSSTTSQVASTNQDLPFANEYATGKKDEVKTVKSLMSSSDSDSERDKIDPANPPKIPKIVPSTSFVTIPTKKLQVLVPTSRFAHVNVYSLIPDDLINLFDNSNYINEDRQRTLVYLVKKIKIRMIRLLMAVKKLNVSLDKEHASVKKIPTNLLETVKQNVVNQKKVTNRKFTSVDLLHIFRKDLRTEALARRGWMSLLTIQLSEGSEVSILDNYMLLGKADLKSSNRARSSELQSPAINMYISL